MTTPYTYLLKHIPSNTYYYGVRYAKGCHPSEFWIKYTTSSIYINKMIEQFGKESFVFEIRKTFDEIETARLWETRVLKKINAVTRQDFINRTDNISISNDDAERGRRNRISSEAHKAAVSIVGKSNAGKKHSLQTKEKVSASLIGNTRRTGKKDSEYTRLKKSISKIGKPSNAVGNYQPVCSCIICGKRVTSSTIKQHSNKHI